MNRERLINLVYNLLPEIYRKKIETKAEYAKVDKYRSITVNTYSIAFTVLILFLIVFQASKEIKGGVFIIASTIIAVSPYMAFSLLANKRKKNIERVLPDALHLISSNLESGLTIEKAFLLSARDEFGPLARDLKKTAMQMFGGKPAEDALGNMEEETNSEMLGETLSLLQDNIKAGGNTAKLLESSAKDIQKSLQLREEIAANVKMYALFIIIAAVFGAPLLFSVSVFLTQNTADLWASQSVDFESLPSTGVFEFKQPSFRPEFFANFAIAAIVISNVFAAILISEIRNGNAKEGIKYMPVFVTLSITLFFITRTVIETALGSFL
ncbi:MAG: type II secretion system F family protein [Candidatus Nanohaloarchaeota archaeon QJJ-9]|nr:type II secretion system F family protein [Candidatus Nanohaloarchaeota archaeon QJJ-9]